MALGARYPRFSTFVPTLTITCSRQPPERRKAAFAKAIEWDVVGRLKDVSINDGTRSYSIAEFASVMALAEIANTAASTEQNAPASAKADIR